MTITISPEVEADIRELLWLWGVDASDPLNVEACARAQVKDGVRATIALVRELRGVPVPQSVPDARVFEDSGTANEQELPAAKPVHWADVLRDVASVPPELLPEEGTQVLSRGKVLVWRGGQWREEGGAK